MKETNKLRGYALPVITGVAVGAAAVVAVGLGIIDSLDDLKKFIPAVKTFAPRAELKPVYDRNFEVFKSLYKCNKKAFAILNK